MSMQPPAGPDDPPRAAGRPLMGRPLDPGAAADLARILWLLCDTTRLSVVMLLCAGDRTVSGLLAEFPGVEDQLISRHLGILRQGGLVDSRKQGRFRVYELTDLGRRVARMLGRLIPG